MDLRPPATTSSSSSCIVIIVVVVRGSWLLEKIELGRRQWNGKGIGNWELELRRKQELAVVCFVGF